MYQSGFFVASMEADSPQLQQREICWQDMRKLTCLLRSLAILWTSKNAGKSCSKNHSQGHAAGIAWWGHPSPLCCYHTSPGHLLRHWVLLVWEMPLGINSNQSLLLSLTFPQFKVASRIIRLAKPGSPALHVSGREN